MVFLVLLLLSIIYTLLDYTTLLPLRRHLRHTLPLLAQLLPLCTTSHTLEQPLQLKSRSFRHLRPSHSERI